MRTAGGAQLDGQVSEQVSAPGAARKVSQLQSLLSMPALTQLIDRAQLFSTTEMAAVLGVSQSTALRYVGVLIKAGLISRVGIGPCTRYQGCSRLALPETSLSEHVPPYEADRLDETPGQPVLMSASRVVGRMLDDLILRQEHFFTAQEIAVRAQVHVSTVLRHIHRLGKPHLKRVGAGPRTRYRVRPSAQHLSMWGVRGQRGPVGNRGKGAPVACSGQGQEEKPVNASPLEDLGPALKRERLRCLLESWSGCTSVKRLVAQTSVPRRTVQRYLNMLLLQGVVRAEGSTRDRHYWLLCERPQTAAARRSPISCESS